MRRKEKARKSYEHKVDRQEESCRCQREVSRSSCLHISRSYFRATANSLDIRAREFRRRRRRREAAAPMINRPPPWRTSTEQSLIFQRALETLSFSLYLSSPLPRNQGEPSRIPCSRGCRGKRRRAREGGKRRSGGGNARESRHLSFSFQLFLQVGVAARIPLHFGFIGYYSFFSARARWGLSSIFLRRISLRNSPFSLPSCKACSH